MHMSQLLGEFFIVVFIHAFAVLLLIQELPPPPKLALQLPI